MEIPRGADDLLAAVQEDLALQLVHRVVVEAHLVLEDRGDDL